MFDLFGSSSSKPVIVRRKVAVPAASVRAVSAPGRTPTSGHSTPAASSPLKPRPKTADRQAERERAAKRERERVRVAKERTEERSRSKKRDARVRPESSDDDEAQVKRVKADTGREVFILSASEKDWEGGVSPWDVQLRVEQEGKVKYVPYFEGLHDERPSVELLYPSGFRERFVLLVPSKRGEYDPIAELRGALLRILAHYIPPWHTHIFGTLDSPDSPNYFIASRPVTPPYTPPSTASPGPGIASPAPGVASPAPETVATIGEALRRAFAPNRRKGPELVAAIQRYNAAMEELRASDEWRAWLQRKTLGGKEWEDMVDFVNDSVVARVVSPYVEQLAKPKRTDELADIIKDKEDSYGELRHVFMSKVIEQTKLGPGKIFVDLGSGVGNCVLQAAVQAGARSYGFELLPVPAHCARLQLDECRRRWAMWSLRYEKDVEVHEGDFRRHPEVARRLKEADVVLVNNEVFSSGLNGDLQNLFLDLKEGARIVSLKPFGQVDFRINDMNCDSFAAIVRTTEHRYNPGWVSWKGESGTYFVHVMDRSRRIKYEELGRARR
ncbi:Nucleosomal histone H3-Lys79 methylase [Cryptotrichosporon argae]